MNAPRVYRGCGQCAPKGPSLPPLVVCCSHAAVVSERTSPPSLTRHAWKSVLGGTSGERGCHRSQTSADSASVQLLRRGWGHIIPIPRSVALRGPRGCSREHRLFVPFANVRFIILQEALQTNLRNLVQELHSLCPAIALTFFRFFLKSRGACRDLL